MFMALFSSAIIVLKHMKEVLTILLQQGNRAGLPPGLTFFTHKWTLICVLSKLVD